jgi:hypothetical protein
MASTAATLASRHWRKIEIPPNTTHTMTFIAIDRVGCRLGLGKKIAMPALETHPWAHGRGDAGKLPLFHSAAAPQPYSRRRQLTHADADADAIVLAFLARFLLHFPGCFPFALLLTHLLDRQSHNLGTFRDHGASSSSYGELPLAPLEQQFLFFCSAQPHATTREPMTGHKMGRKGETLSQSVSTKLSQRCFGTYCGVIHRHKANVSTHLVP